MLTPEEMERIRAEEEKRAAEERYRAPSRSERRNSVARGWGIYIFPGNIMVHRNYNQRRGQPRMACGFTGRRLCLSCYLAVGFGAGFWDSRAHSGAGGSLAADARRENSLDIRENVRSEAQARNRPGARPSRQSREVSVHWPQRTRWDLLGPLVRSRSVALACRAPVGRGTYFDATGLFDSASISRNPTSQSIQIGWDDPRSVTSQPSSTTGTSTLLGSSKTLVL